MLTCPRFASFVIASVMLSSTNGMLTGQDEAKEDQSVGLSIKKAYESSAAAKTQKDFSQTIRLCDQALALDVKESQQKYLNQLKAWALVARARLFQLKNPAELDNEEKTAQESVESMDPVKLAIQDCTAAIKLDPLNWKARKHRAKRYWQLKEYQSALQDLDAAIRQQPTEADLWFNRAELLYAREEYEVAVADYSEAIKLDAGDVQALTGRGHCYVHLDKPLLALADYDEVIERTRKSAEAYLNRGDLHLSQKQFKLAGEDYRDALTRDQSLAQAYRGVGWMYATSEQDKYFNPTVADRSIKRAIELDGKETVENLVVLAAAQAAGGEYKMARDTLKRVKSEKQMSSEVKRRLKHLETRKWYLAGSGN